MSEFAGEQTAGSTAAPNSFLPNPTNPSGSSPQTSKSSNSAGDSGKLFTLKKWNAVAMWSWDVECDTCAICRVQVRPLIPTLSGIKLTPLNRCQVMDACLRCQGESKVDSRSPGGSKDCVVVWGECNHSFHHCCMSLWIKQNNRCPLCQQEWTVQKLGK